MHKEINQNRAERVKIALGESELTQNEVAKLAHITPQHLTNVKNGKKQLTEDVAEQLARILEVRFEWLMDYDNFQTNEKLEKYYIERFDARDNALQIILDSAITEVCLREGVKPKTLDNIPEMLYLMAQIKDYADSLVWQYLFHREHSSTWAILDERGKD